jgi:outer membrane receptor protein involved in Fe transport
VHSFPPERSLRAAAAVLAALVLSAAAVPSGAQPAATTPNPPAGAPAPARPASPTGPGTGTLRGQVLDGETGTPVAGATVTLIPPAAAGAEPRPEVRTTGDDGNFDFGPLRPGTYELRLSKAGYQDPAAQKLALRADQVNRADVALEPARRSDPMSEIEEFVVVGSADELASLDLRVNSDELLNVLSAEELANFAATDVAEGLKRIAGVNVVEGQFAIIRGLEDRYSSTLYNGAPVPSPDPDRQSVQLDLFPSEIVSNLVVAKTFAADLPSNSSGGSINVITSEYPEEFEFAVKAGPGFNTNALDRFLEFQDGSAMGKENEGHGPIESEVGAFLGGRGEAAGREFRYKAVGNWEIDYATEEGVAESRAPREARTRNIPAPPRVVESGDLSLGQLGLSGGSFDETVSERSDQLTGYLGLGFDLDREGAHRIDASTFYTRKRDETVELDENGYLPNFDYGTLAEKQANGLPIDRNADFDGFATPTAWIARTVRGDPNEPASRGPLWFASFFESQSFERDRDLLVAQVNGDHWLEAVPGLHLSWASNLARTTEEEKALGVRFFFEPDDTEQTPTSFPTTPAALGPGRFAANDGIFSNGVDIHEKQRFARLDAEYDTELSEAVSIRLNAGGWYEHASRDVDSSYLESPTVGGSSQFALFGDTPEELGEVVASQGFTGFRDAANESSREIKAASLGAKATFWQRVDLLGGLRLENLFIDSQNDPFTGELALDGSPDIYPKKWVLFDRLDNPARNEVLVPPPPGTTFNDQLLGLEVPVDPVTGFVDLPDRASIESLLNGEIDETRLLPAIGFAYRPLEGLSLRGAWSQTMARPSFREMGYYVTVEPGTDDLVIGNPQLVLSDVESFDLRAEYVWGDLGDLFAVSGFYKTIEEPIESIVLRDPTNLDGADSALFRTFFNNPNEASLWGIEVEGRKNLGFLGFDLAEYLSAGANFTYIDARVDRIEAELARSRSFFGTAAGDVEQFSELEGSRRLFGQPEWIANGDLTFDHPGWGTKATLAVFAISDVLDAAGSAAIGPSGDVVSFVPDRYVGSFYQLDLILSQTWRVDLLRGDVTFKVSLKNLTDSTRKLVYDLNQTSGEIAERSFKVGRDFKFTLTYAF